MDQPSNYQNINHGTREKGQKKKRKADINPTICGLKNKKTAKNISSI